MNQVYLDTARLMIQIAPLVFADNVFALKGGTAINLFVRRDKLEVKVEVNFVLRGTVHPIRSTSLTPKAKETLLADMELPVVSLEALYGGKLVAALDAVPTVLDQHYARKNLVLAQSVPAA